MTASVRAAHGDEMGRLRYAGVLAAFAAFGCANASDGDTPARAVSAPQAATPAEEPAPAVAAPAAQGASVVAKAREALRARDYPAARGFYTTACDEHDDAASCFQLAQLLERGRGGPAEPERARELLLRACASDLQQACDQLGH